MVECNTQHNSKEHQLDLGYLQQTLAAANSAFDNALYPKALEHYQSVMHDIDTVLPYQILMQCARAHRAVGELKLAIDDVLRAIARYPIDPCGYLLAADLYLEQDMLRDTLLICDEGCANANVDMPGYQDLQSMRRKVIYRVLVRNSWVSERLSGEIIDQILSLLPIKSQVQLAMTCKHWNTYVFSFWPGLWNTVRLTCLSDQKERLLSTIPGHKVRHLIIDTGIPWKARERLITNKWDQLESLVYAERDMAPWNWFQQLVEMNKTTLKRVELYESETVQYSKGWIYLILSACTNLETFRCFGYKNSTSGSVLIPTSSISLADYQLLASLTLPIVRISATSPSIARCLPEILPHCPNLEDISFDDYEIESSGDHDDDNNNERLLCRMLTAIDRHCPMIKKIEINTQPSPYEHWYPSLPSSSGLQSFSFQLSKSHHGDDQSDQVLTSFVEKHHTTLGRIWIVHNGLVPWSMNDGRPMRYLQRLSQLDIPRVRDLCIALQDDGHTTASDVNQLSLSIGTVNSILQRLQSLEYLQLIDCFAAEVLQTIADKLDRRRLRVLRLVNHKTDQCEQRSGNLKQYRGAAIGSLCRFFDYTMNLLSVVDLDIGRWVNNEVLRAIGRNDKQHQHVLTRLRIGKGHKITSGGLLDFAEDMRQSQLTHLSIDLCNVDKKMIDDLLEFATFPHLINIDINTNRKYCHVRATIARFFSASRNTLHLKISYATPWDYNEEDHRVYTCSEMDGDEIAIYIRLGSLGYGHMGANLRGEVVWDDMCPDDCGDSSDGND